MIDAINHDVDTDATAMTMTITTTTVGESFITKMPTMIIRVTFGEVT